MYYFRLKAIGLCFLLTFVLQGISFAQLKRVTAPNMISKPAIYVNSKGKRYSTEITFEFKRDIINLSKGVTNASVSQISLPKVKHFLNTIRQKYGNFKIVKLIPSANWGDTVRINKRTGKIVYIKDMSQYFRLMFSNLVPVDSIAHALVQLPGIANANGPVPIILTASPNDPEYQISKYRWAFKAIDASRAWDITKGASDIRIDINGAFDALNTIHEDLINKVVYRSDSSASGGHGTEVAGIAGAETNNNLDVASLGWKTSIMFSEGNVANQIVNADSNGADIINFSWIYKLGYPIPNAVKKAIHNFLKEGNVCISSAGNDSTTLKDYSTGQSEQPPKVVYPAAYNFGSDGQVIAVSATTDRDPDSTEEFIPNFNYSPGTDPINDPTHAFIDCSAPGGNMEVLNPNGTTGTSYVWAGTSYSTPFVSALVSLILSVNNKLTPPQIYKIITKSADKIGSHTYDSNGWNQYMGYGRINAYKALKYTLKHYGATFTQDATLPADTYNISANLKVVSGATLTIQPGATLNFSNNATLTANGVLKAEGSLSKPIIFTSYNVTSAGSWGSIILNGSGANGSTLNHIIMQYGTNVQANNTSNITIENSTFTDNIGAIKYYNATGKVIGNTIRNPGSAHGITITYGSDVTCNLNTLTRTNEDHNELGIVYANGSSGLIGGNDIAYFNWGITTAHSSSVPRPRSKTPQIRIVVTTV